MNKLFSAKNLIRILVALVIVLSIAAGYYHSAYTLEQRKYAKLESEYRQLQYQVNSPSLPPEETN